MPKVEKLSKEARAALPNDTVAYIESLEKAQEAKTPVAPVATPEATALAEFEKAVAEMPEGARAILRKQQRDVTEARAIAKGLFDVQEDAKFEAFAKSLKHVPGIAIVGDGLADTVAKFRTMAENEPDAWEQVSKSLTSAENSLAQSALFGTIGTGHTGTPGSAGETIEGMAKALQEKDAELSFPEALAKAAEQASRDNPALIEQHRREQLHANANPGE